MGKPRLYADFHNADAQGRLRLNCAGTIQDLTRQNVQPSKGMQVLLYADDLDDKGQLDELIAGGVVSYSNDDSLWVATIDWNAIRHASESGVNKPSPMQPTSQASNEAVGRP